MKHLFEQKPDYLRLTLEGHFFGMGNDFLLELVRQYLSRSPEAPRLHNSKTLTDDSDSVIGHTFADLNIMVDLVKVERLDSSFIGGMIILFKFIRDKGGALVFLNPDASIRSIFEHLKLADILPILANEDAALGSLKNQREQLPVSYSE